MIAKNNVPSRDELEGYWNKFVSAMMSIDWTRSRVKKAVDAEIKNLAGKG